MLFNILKPWKFLPLKYQRNYINKYYGSFINPKLSKIREKSSGKLHFYSKIFKKFEQEYLNFNIQKELRKQLTKLKISAHPLAIETGRYSKPKISRNERFCKFCKDQVEDESHFLLKCPNYNLLRQKYGIDNENNEDSSSFIINLLNPSSSRNLKTICLFLKEAFEEQDQPTALNVPWTCFRSQTLY